jgi:pimeloyl-ACP methyl ester carboxylesterase
MREFAIVLAFVVCQQPAFGQARVPPDGTRNGLVESGEARIYYEETGAGETIVLIHAGLLNLTMWDDQVREFADRYRVVRYDLRGHGRTESPRSSFSHVDDLSALLDHLGVSRVILVGISMGIEPILQFAVTHPDRVASLVAVSPGITDGHPSAQLQEHEDALEKAFLSSAEEFVEVFATTWLDGPTRSPQDTSRELRSRVKEMALEARSQLDLRRQSVRLDPPVKERLSELTMPALIVRGSLDMPDTRRAADELAAEIPQAKEVVLEGAAHLVSLEIPAAFNTMLEGFLESTKDHQLTN